jgi:hypothetical protein
MALQTPQPRQPFERDGKWYFVRYTLKGSQEMGHYEDEVDAKADFLKTLRIHEANGYSDGEIANHLRTTRHPENISLWGMLWGPKRYRRGK